LLERECCQRRLSEFIAQAWPWVEPGTEFYPGWHLDAIAEHLEAVSKGQIRNLLINIPPRHMKSLSVSVFWPTWTWTFKPSTRWLFAAYAQSLTIRDSIRCRRLIESPWYRKNWGSSFQFAGDQNVKSRFDNDKGGFRIATSVGGSVTGEGGDILVIDDPHNVVEAESEVVREGVCDWFDQVWSTRRNDPKTSAMVIVMQRVHQVDLSGHVLAKGNWEHLCLPAEYDGRRCVTVRGDMDKRTQDGDLLWPTRFGTPELAELKKNLGLYGAAGQLQQRPFPKGGGLFKRGDFDLVDAVPANAFGFCRAWDCAATEPGDRTAGVLMCRAPDDHFYIKNVVKGRWLPAERNRIIKQTAGMDGDFVRVRVDQEPGSSGIDQVDSIIRMLEGFSVEGVLTSGKSKEVRADPFAGQVGIKRVRLVKGEWNAEYLDELEAFPNGEHDDQVDATSLAFSYVVKAYDRHYPPKPPHPGRDIDVFDEDPVPQETDGYRPSGSPMEGFR
jgi:predicted phage terminase large subunit-like protein